ncbi:MULTISPECIES: hypothetical protein [Chryseobacterium group]|uniref:hypothetical protein n=1 Tax=Chryseobacterium group TaxID=2782232 RepID=UPI0012B6528D|nr:MULTISPECIES: hypothetical protein [Chryseobacterium group]
MSEIYFYELFPAVHYIFFFLLTLFPFPKKKKDAVAIGAMIKVPPKNRKTTIQQGS